MIHKFSIPGIDYLLEVDIPDGFVVSLPKKIWTIIWSFWMRKGNYPYMPRLPMMILAESGFLLWQNGLFCTGHGITSMK